MSALTFLEDTARNAVLTAAERLSINTSVSALQSRMMLQFPPGVIREHFRFGSSTRDTILPRSLDEHSDIDYMVVFKEGNATPQTYLNRLKRFVEERYGSSEIYQSSPTIVLDLNHIKFELVPATTNLFGQYQIPNGAGGWMITNPNDFNATLEAKNQSHNSLIRPTIRLFKFWNAANGYPLSSFLMEQWVCGLNLWWLKNQKDYLFTVFDALHTLPKYSQAVNGKIARAKAIVANVRQYERDSAPTVAEVEVKKLFCL